MKSISIKSMGKKIQAVGLGVVLTASSVAGAGLFDTSFDDFLDNGNSDLGNKAEAPNKIDNQIDENSQKLETVSSENTQNSTDYTMLGC